MHRISLIFLVFCIVCGTSIALLTAKQVFATQSAIQILKKHSGMLQHATTAGMKKNVGEFVSVYEELQIPTLLGIYLVDITADIRRIVKASGVDNGVVTVLSRHTTTAITINEMEGRLVDDTRQFLLKLVPAACEFFSLVAASNVISHFLNKNLEFLSYLYYKVENDFDVFDYCILT